MLDEIVGVRHAIALNVWPVGILRIRPPIVAFGKKVMHAPGAPRAVRRRDGDWLLGEVLFCRFQDPTAIESGEIEACLLSRGRKAAQGHNSEGEKQAFHKRRRREIFIAPELFHPLSPFMGDRTHRVSDGPGKPSVRPPYSLPRRDKMFIASETSILFQLRKSVIRNITLLRS